MGFCHLAQHLPHHVSFIIHIILFCFDFVVKDEGFFVIIIINRKKNAARENLVASSFTCNCLTLAHVLRSSLEMIKESVVFHYSSSHCVDWLHIVHSHNKMRSFPYIDLAPVWPLAILICFVRFRPHVDIAGSYRKAFEFLHTKNREQKNAFEFTVAGRCTYDDYSNLSNRKENSARLTQ